MSQFAKAEPRPAFDIYTKAERRCPISRTFVYGGHDSEVPVFYVGVESILEGGKPATGVGVERSRDRAFFSAVLELIERRSLAVPTDEALFRNDSGILCVRALSLAGGEEILIPAQAVFWNYDLALSPEPVLAEPNVNGGGIAFSKEEALAFGIYECVERDALLLLWFLRNTPPRVDLDGIDDEEAMVLLDAARKIGLETHILDITSDIPVPAYLVVLVRGEPRAVSLGSSANLNPMSAIRKALHEAWGNYILNSIIAEKPGLLERSDSAAKERYQLWHASEVLSRLSFLLEGDFVPLRRCQGPGDESETLKAIFDNRGLAVYFYESGHSLLKKLGLYAVKAVIPKLLPFYFREENARFALQHPRLAGRIRNSFPHPFA